MPQEPLPLAEKSEQRIGAIKAKIRQLEKQVEEWCEESQRSATGNVLSIELLRYSDAPRP